jgi:hypothetical protein
MEGQTVDVDSRGRARQPQGAALHLRRLSAALAQRCDGGGTVAAQDTVSAADVHRRHEGFEAERPSERLAERLLADAPSVWPCADEQQLPCHRARTR